MPLDSSITDTSPEDDSPAGNPQLTVVGIGASAGGLTALRTLFSGMPDDTGFAFVVVVHLSPDKESVLGELLQPRTGMKVIQVTEHTPVEANLIYVIPPNRNLSTIDSICA